MYLHSRAASNGDNDSENQDSAVGDDDPRYFHQSFSGGYLIITC